MDRKLDAWIAVNIFKWDPLTWDGHDESAIPAILCPNYTSDMNMAIRVLQKLNEKHSLLLRSEDLTEVIALDYYSWPYDEEITYAVHESPQKAICLAAYKLKTGEDYNANNT